MKRNLMIISLSLLFLYYNHSLRSESNGAQFEEIPKAKLVGKLKGVAFAAIRTSMIKRYQFTEEKEIKYSPCSVDFPILPGEFPCSLLSWDEEAIPLDVKAESDDGSSVQNEPNLDEDIGGKVSILFSKSKSPNIEGDVAILGEDADSLTLFYDKEKYLSHYKFQSTVAIFRWKSVETVRTLSGIMLIKLDSDSFPVSAKEVSFTTP